MEVDELLPEALLVRRDLFLARSTRGVGFAVFGDEQRGHAAEKRRRKRQGHAPLRRVESELHLVARDYRQVDPREDALRRSVLEDRGQAGLADVGELQAFWLAEDAAHGIEFVNE